MLLTQTTCYIEERQTLTLGVWCGAFKRGHYMSATQTVESAPHGTTDKWCPSPLSKREPWGHTPCVFLLGMFAFQFQSRITSLRCQGLIWRGVCNHAFMSWEQRNAVTQPLGNVCRAEGGSAFCLPMWGAHGVWPLGGRGPGVVEPGVSFSWSSCRHLSIARLHNPDPQLLR